MPTEGRLSFTAKRKREGSTDSEKEFKRPCVDFQATPSSSITTSPAKFVRRAFVKSSNDSVITINEKQFPKKLPSTSNTNNKPRPSPTTPKQLFKDSKMGSDKLHSLQLTKSPSTARKAHSSIIIRINYCSEIVIHSPTDMLGGGSVHLTNNLHLQIWPIYYFQLGLNTE